MQTSTLIGKRLLTPEGEPFGTVLGARFTKGYREISGLLCADGEEREFFLPRRAILEIGEELIAEKARGKSAGLPSPLSKPVFTRRGVFLGLGEELIVGESPYFFWRGKLSGGCPAERLVCGDIVLLGDGVKKRETKNAPERARGSYEADLLNRTVKREIADERGKILFRAGERITPATIRKAGERNLLLTLAANAD